MLCRAHSTAVSCFNKMRYTILYFTSMLLSAFLTKLVRIETKYPKYQNIYFNVKVFLVRYKMILEWYISFFIFFKFFNSLLMQRS